MQQQKSTTSDGLPFRGLSTVQSELGTDLVKVCTLYGDCDCMVMVMTMMVIIMVMVMMTTVTTISMTTSTTTTRTKITILTISYFVTKPCVELSMIVYIFVFSCPKQL